MTARLVCLLWLLAPTSLYAQPVDPLPAHALARLGSTLPCHVWPVGAVAFAPNGKTLASCDHRSVRLWDVATGRQLQLHRNDHLEAVAVLAFSADGKWLAAGGRRWATIYDVVAGKLHQRLDHGNVPVRRLAFTPDGRTLVTADYHTPRQWDTATGKLVRVFPAVEGSENRVNALSTSPDGKSLLLLDNHPIASWWDLDSGKRTRCLDLDGGGGNRGVFTPEGAWLIRPVGQEKLAYIDLATGKIVRTFPDGDRRVCPSVTAEGKHLVGFEKNKLCFWNLTTGVKIVEVPKLHEYTGQLALSPAGDLLAYADGYQVFVIDSATGKMRRTIGKAPTIIENVSFLADGKTAAVMSSPNRFFDESRRQLWDLASGKIRGDERVMPGPLYCTRFQDHLCAIAIDGNISLWDLATAKKFQTLVTGSSDARTPMSFSPDRSRFAGFFYLPSAPDTPYRSAIRVWQTIGGKEVRTLEVSGMAMHTMTFTPDGQAIALTCGGPRLDGDPEVNLVFWNPDTGHTRSRLLHGLRAAPEIVFSPDGRLLAVSSRYVNCIPIYLGIFVYEVATGRLLWTTRPENETGRFRDHLQFSRDGQTLMAVQGACVQFWHAATGQPRARLAGHEQTVTSLALSPDGRTLLTSSADTTVLHWDVADLLKPTLTPEPLNQSKLHDCWTALGDQNPAAAYRAIDRLRASPTQAVAFMEKNLRAIPLPDDATLAKHLNALNASRFSVRQQATAALEQCGDAVLPLLHARLKESPTPEARLRIEGLCAKLTEHGANDLRTIRGVAVLEGLGTPPARLLLEKFAAGTPGARLTREAETALGRLRGSRVP